MARKEIDYTEVTPRQKVWDPTGDAKNSDLVVPDCSHTYGFGSFMHPVVADERDLPCDGSDDGTASGTNKRR